MIRTQFAIVGAGPTGIGAALRLMELGYRDFVVIDAADAPGGLASSFSDPHGFTWDLGGHVQFSHYRKFDDYMDLALPAEDWLWHERESWIWWKDRFVPYPFQNNLHRLPAEERWRAIEGLLGANAAAGSETPGNFREWILATFGQGIADLFLFPYNFKVWGHPLDLMDSRWVGERVAVPSLHEALRSVCLAEDQVSWGPNRRFRFPRRGGTGAVWRSLGSRIPAANLKMLTRVDAIDARRRIVTFHGGEQLSYSNLINTAPLDWICRTIGQDDLAARTARLKSSVVHVIGIGLQGAPPKSIEKMCWIYFPGSDSSFYRVTVFSNYSPNNVPQPGGTWSLMAEVAETAHLPRNRARVVEDVVQQMVSIGLITDAREILSRWHRILEPGYPTPSLERDAILNDALPVLETQNIYSRGRFGAWKYEVSNQDHSFMQGVEVVDRLVFGRFEPTLNHPAKINQNYNSFPYGESEAA